MPLATNTLELGHAKTPQSRPVDIVRKKNTFLISTINTKERMNEKNATQKEKKKHIFIHSILQSFTKPRIMIYISSLLFIQWNRIHIIYSLLLFGQSQYSKPSIKLTSDLYNCIHMLLFSPKPTHLHTEKITNMYPCIRMSSVCLFVFIKSFGAEVSIWLLDEITQ